jgi:esterase/lipase
MAQASINDWLSDTMEALWIGERIGEKVIVVGTSTGGTLATWLAQQPENEDVLAYVLISPNYGLFDKRSEVITCPWGSSLVKLLIGEEYAYEPVNEASAIYWTCRYPSVALVTMVALVKHVRKAGFEQIKTPVLVLYSPEDPTVDPIRTEQYFPRFGSSIKEIHRIEDARCPDKHVLAGNMRGPECTEVIQDIILEFLSQLD